MRILAVDTGLGARARATMVAVAGWLTAAGALVEVRELPHRELPRRLDRGIRRLWESFTATPAPLVESWRIARHLDAMTEPGDTVLLSDHRGGAGMFALEQAMRLPAERRQVVVAAGDAVALEYLAVAGTLDALPEEDEAAVDWELVSYRFAAAVLAPSPAAARLVRLLGFDAEPAAVPDPPVPAAPGERAIGYLPEPFSRISASLTILRGVGAALEARPDLRVVAAPGDAADRIWNGTTWEAGAPVRAPLADRLRRGEPPEGALWILGDPFALPGPDVVAHRDRGGALLVAAGSAASARWPDAPVWGSEADIAGWIAEPVAGPLPSPAAAPRLPDLSPAAVDPDRARRVSVGVPIFRDVAYLEECVQSLLDQEEPVHEILLVDDGSRSPEVDEALHRWQGVRPDVVRTIRQPNLGVCVARNTALLEMTGDAFVFVDADDVLHPRFVAACAAALRAHPALWAVATWTEFFGAYEGVEAKPPFDVRVGRRENPIVSTCVLVDMRAREAGIRFDPGLSYVFCEDWDVWAQIVAAGGEMGLVPEALARHRVHAVSGGYRRSPLALSLGRARAVARLDGR